MAKVYIVKAAEAYLLPSGKTWVDHVVSGIFLSRNAAEEYIDYHQPYTFDQYSIREELVRS